jgi:hypothetical protein
MPGKPTLFPALVLLAGLLTGCYESSDITVYEPGEYKGKRDPLLSQDPGQRAETLAKRFEMVQTDR